MVVAARGVGVVAEVLAGQARVVAQVEVLVLVLTAPRMLDRRALKKALAVIARAQGKLAGAVA